MNEFEKRHIMGQTYMRAERLYRIRALVIKKEKECGLIDGKEMMERLKQAWKDSCDDAKASA